MKRSADPNSDKMRAEFRQKLGNYQAAPSENLWDKIELSLDKEEALVYKNRFRVYSRLAAACLLLLLAFGVVFIPTELKHLKEESSELAQTQNTETGKNSDPQLQKPADQLSGIAARETTSADKATGPAPTQNAIPSEEKTAVSKSETKEQIAYTPAPARNANTVKNTSPEMTQTEKTVAFGASKVTTRPQNQGNISAEGAPEDLQNGMVAAAKTARTKTAASETINPNQTASIAFNESAAPIAAPEIVAASPAITSAPETESPIQAETSEIAMASKQTAVANTESGSGNNHAAADYAQQPETEKAPMLAKAETFSPQNHSVSETKKNRKGISFLSSKTARLPKSETVTTVVPDTNTLAVIPEAKAVPKAEIPVVKDLKTGKWLLAVGYSGRSFKPGMQLASQAKINPGAGSIVSNQEQMQNLAQYEAAIQEFNEETQAVLSHGGALQVGYKLSENWQLQSGFTYFRHQAQTMSHYAFAVSGFGNTSINPQPGYQPPQTLQPTLQTVLAGSFDPADSEIVSTPASKTTYSFQQVGVPVNLRYQTVSPGLYCFAAAGFSMNLLTSTTISYQQQQITYTPVSASAKYYSVSGNPVNSFRKWLPAVGFQLGAGYHLSGHWQAELALEGDQYLKPLIQAEHMAGTSQKNPVSVGASVKLGYSF